MNGTPAPPRWRRLDELGTPNGDVDYVLNHPLWSHPIVCRWDGTRWMIRTPYNVRGVALQSQLGEEVGPSYFLALAPIREQIQADLDRAKAEIAKLMLDLPPPKEDLL